MLASRKFYFGVCIYVYGHFEFYMLQFGLCSPERPMCSRFAPQGGTRRQSLVGVS
jgi:hypothetical protein